MLQQGSEPGTRGSDLGIYRLMCGEQNEDGKRQQQKDWEVAMTLPRGEVVVAWTGWKPGACCHSHSGEMMQRKQQDYLVGRKESSQKVICCTEPEQ